MNAAPRAACRTTHGPVTPDAAVRVVPQKAAALVLATQVFVANGEHGRQIGSAMLLHREGDGQSWLSRSAWLLAFRRSSVGLPDRVDRGRCK